MDQKRRTFISGAVATPVIASAFLATAAQASDLPGLPGKNLFYTKANPGQWDKKAATHVPMLEVAGSKVTLSTPHPMTPEHFIVRHNLLLADGTVVGAKTLTPADQPITTYELPAGYKGKIYGTSFCNQHDFWLTEATV